MTSINHETLRAASIIRMLDLKPLPHEGGYYRETYRAPLTIAESSLPENFQGDRNASTAIYFLLTPDEKSVLHTLPTDVVFHFYLGDPVEMLMLHPKGLVERQTLGSNLLEGFRPQLVIPGGAWQGAELKAEHGYALLGCTLAPGFDYRDFRVASAADLRYLLKEFPKEASAIRRLAPHHPAHEPEPN